MNWITHARTGGLPIEFVQATLHRAAEGMTAELAWFVTPSVQGHGFATEAEQQVATWLHSMHAQELDALIHPEREALAHVARRIEMHSTTISRDGEGLWRKRLAAMDKR